MNAIYKKAERIVEKLSDETKLVLLISYFLILSYFGKFYNIWFLIIDLITTPMILYFSYEKEKSEREIKKLHKMLKKDNWRYKKT